jgi:hypothetical protein
MSARLGLRLAHAGRFPPGVGAPSGIHRAIQATLDNRVGFTLAIVRLHDVIPERYFPAPRPSVQRGDCIEGQREDPEQVVRSRLCGR